MRREIKMILRAAFLMFAFISVSAGANAVRAQDDGGGSAVNTAALTRRLQSLDPVTRQTAAEDVARLAAPEMLKMVEGFRREEKDARVQLAMDWALYRLGKSDRLFYVVKALDSSRADQAQNYLYNIESPEPLYQFLNSTDRKMQRRLLEILGRVGNTETLAHVEPFTKSSDHRLARAAREAQSEIIGRQKSINSPANATRPRRTGESEQLR
jgi:hypothetical protein